MSHRLFLVITMIATLAVIGCAGSGDGDKEDGGVMPPLDTDGDFIPDDVEGDGDPDGDGIPNYKDDDSDGDFILDSTEGIGDPDKDGIPNFLDLDSDQDCRGDAAEAGDEDLKTPPLDSDGDGLSDAIELDSDADGLPDYLEDANCNGTREDPETDARNSDTDGDGVSDLIEVADRANGSDPLDPTKNPLIRGDFVFVMPYQEPSKPTSDDLDFSTNLKTVDVYFLLDRSGSMRGEINSLRSNIVTVMNDLTCGSPTDTDCIPDIWAGAGGVGYPAADGESYKHIIDVQSSPAALMSALMGSGSDPLSEPGCDGQLVLGTTVFPENNPDRNRPCDEVTQLSLWSILTGKGSESAKSTVGAGTLVCSDHAGIIVKDRRVDPVDSPSNFVANKQVPFGTLLASSYADQASCPLFDTDEDGTAETPGIGYPCFRPNALPVVLYATDESSGITVNCPKQSDIITEANAIGAKLVGVAGSGSGPNLLNEMRNMATMTGAIDITPMTGPQPLLVQVSNEAQTADAVKQAILVLANGVPLKITAEAKDAPNDAKNAVMEFIERLQVQQAGDGCMNMLTVIDTNNDTFADTYQQVRPGTPVCWSVVAKMNTTVQPIEEPQIFKATIEVRGNNITKLDERNVWFLVPPKVDVVPIGLR